MNNVLEWLETTTQRTPDAVAFADAERQLTFAELHDQARAAGAWLAERIEARQPVAFFLEKSTRAIAGMMGAVYARGFYCVLDIRQPAPRLEQIAGTLKPALVLTDEDNEQEARAIFEPLGLAVHLVDEALGHAVESDALQALEQLRAQAQIDDPVYVNFTSGSTGTPKGVMVGHRSIIDFIGPFTEIFGITAEDRIANQAPFDFDVSVKDIYSGLATGAAVHMIPREYFSIPVQLMDYLCERAVTVCTWAVSAMCFVTTMGGFDYRVPETVRRVIFSGEVMPAKHLARWRAALPHALFANVYGPTEVTCNCTYYLVERDFAADEPIPIGRPFPGETVLLLDWGSADADAAASGVRQISPAEVGVEGEICVGGDCLALGYVNEPERTAKAFVDNPIASEPATLYRTGDLAYYNEAGELVYAGRTDHQIKHLGQRIELGEIEAAAQGVEGVERSCCLYDSRKKRIHLLYLGSIDKSDLAAALKEKLPSYMAPNKIHPLEQMPLNKNGKIDRKALAEQAGISQ